MNLLEIRTKAAQVSGRWDLVNNTTFADNGMDYYIRAGQRYLDLTYFGRRLEGRYIVDVDADQHLINVPIARAIHEVWIHDGENRVKLEKKTFSWLKENYPAVINQQESGTPLYYAAAITRGIRHFGSRASNQAGEDFSVVDADVISDPTHEINSIIIMPPPEDSCTAEVWGLYYSNSLIEDTDESFWSVSHEDVLIHAAFRAIEVEHRNTQGVTDWTNAINSQMSGIIFDDLEEEIQDVNQMEG